MTTKDSPQSTCDKEVPCRVEEPRADDETPDSSSVVSRCFSKHRLIALTAFLVALIAAVLLGVFLGRRGDGCSSRCYSNWETLCDCVQETSDNQVFTLCSGTFPTNSRVLELPAKRNITFTCESAATGTHNSEACVLIPRIEDLETVFLSAVENGGTDNRVTFKHLTFTGDYSEAPPANYYDGDKQLISGVG